MEQKGILTQAASSALFRDGLVLFKNVPTEYACSAVLQLANNANAPCNPETKHPTNARSSHSLKHLGGSFVPGMVTRHSLSARMLDPRT